MARHDDPDQHDLPTKEEKYADMVGCLGCKLDGPHGPPHFASTFCESNGRHWDKATQTFVGRSHCSCDRCF